jgi:hypothetical protein
MSAELTGDVIMVALTVLLAVVAIWHFLGRQGGGS